MSARFHKPRTPRLPLRVAPRVTEAPLRFDFATDSALHVYKPREFLVTVAGVRVTGVTFVDIRVRPNEVVFAEMGVHPEIVGRGFTP